MDFILLVLSAAAHEGDAVSIVCGMACSLGGDLCCLGCSISKFGPTLSLKVVVFPGLGNSGGSIFGVCMGLTLLQTYLQCALLSREGPQPGSSSVTNSATPGEPFREFCLLRY